MPGLSESQVENFLSHSHARNNRAVLFSLACAMTIHLGDMVALEEPSVAEAVKSLHDSAMQKPIVSDSSAPYSGKRTTNSKSSQQNPTPALASTQKTSAYRGLRYDRTTDVVTDDIIKVGKLVREKYSSAFARGRMDHILLKLFCSRASSLLYDFIFFLGLLTPTSRKHSGFVTMQFSTLQIISGIRSYLSSMHFYGT